MAALSGLPSTLPARSRAISVASIQPAPDSVLTQDTARAFEGVAERESGLVILLDLNEAVPRTEYAHVAAAEAAEEGGSDA